MNDPVATDLRPNHGTAGAWPCLVAALACALTAITAQATAHDFQPLGESETVERLPARIRSAEVLTPTEAATTARRWVLEARRSAEPRYLGRAQAALGAWWGRADAPPQIAVLQATIEQSRHEFADARATLERTLAREPVNAQGWLTLATIERVAGQYEAALAACQRVVQSGAPLYGEACRLETRSLLGHHGEARAGLDGLLGTANGESQRAWLLSLIGENEERAGNDAAALAAYRASLVREADHYTALALADLLLRRSDRQGATGALEVLATHPDSDAVQLRRAQAMKQLDDPRWSELAQDLTQRFEALAERGDDPALHAREAAQFALWIAPDGARAFEAAQANLRLQKEPLDWRLAFLAAEAAGRPQQRELLAKQLRETGLVDARLARWTASGVK